MRNACILRTQYCFQEYRGLLRINIMIYIDEFAILYNSFGLDRRRILVFMNVSKGQFMSTSLCMIHALDIPWGN